MRRTITALFAIYLALLVWAVIWKVHDPFIGRDDMREIKLIPFVSGDGHGPSALVEVLANVVLFVPLGLYLAALGARWKPLVIVGTSVALEIAQFALATGSSDVTDVIVNTAGGLLGVGIAALVKPRWLVGVLIAGTVLAVVAIYLYSRTFPVMQPGGGVTIA